MMLPDLALGTLALLVLILPGWLWARSRRLPVPVFAGFIAGLVTLVLLVHLLDALELRSTLLTMLAVWLPLSIVAGFFARRRPAGPARPADWHGQWLLMLPVIPAAGLVAYRAIAQPLSGVDTIFRWNFLAELMLRRGALDFYPPVTAADYSLYGWADGIAPTVSSLYFWCYAFAGDARPVLTAPSVILQFLLLLAGVWLLVRRRAPARAAAFACALLAASPLVLWSTAMGQETGLTALALLGLLLYLPAADNPTGEAGAVMAGLSAAAGALAREYGLVFMLFGLGLALARRSDRKLVFLFMLTALACVLPWYVRNWLHTGNPLFNLEVGGLFPVNAAHLALMGTYREFFGWTSLPVEAPWILVPNAIAALLGAGAGLAVAFRATRVWFAAAAMVVSLWIVSLGFTAAGFTYSLRVLAPALVLAAAMGGIALAHWVPGRKYLPAVASALLLLSLDAALRALVLPANVYRLPPAAWLTAGGAVHEYHAQPMFAELVRHTAGHRLLVLGPNALLARQGAQTVPLWSPEVGFLWDESVDAETATRRLAAANLDYVLLGRGPVNQHYLARIPFFRRKVSDVLEFVWAGDDLMLFRVKPPTGPPSET